eukprot:2139206-Prymnesium_polylepis.1
MSETEYSRSPSPPLASAPTCVFTAAGITALASAGVAGAGSALGSVAAGDVITTAHAATILQATGFTLARATGAGYAELATKPPAIPRPTYAFTAAGVAALTNAGVAGAGVALGSIAAGDEITGAQETKILQATGFTLARAVEAGYAEHLSTPPPPSAPVPHTAAGVMEQHTAQEPLRLSVTKECTAEPVSEESPVSTALRLFLDDIISLLPLADVAFVALRIDRSFRAAARDRLLPAL